MKNQRSPATRGGTLALLAAFGVGLCGLPATAQALRVCADPDYLPFSNRAGEGFENEIAAEVASALGTTLEYTWANTRERGFPQFLEDTLKAQECDLVMSIPYGSREASSTEPYYVSSYVFVFKRSMNYALTSMNSPVLSQVKIGYEMGTPVEEGLKMRSLVPGVPGVIPFAVAETSGQSPESMLDALDNEDIDVLITWLPAIGSFLSRHPDLEVVIVPNDRTLGPPEQYSFPMSMGVREGDEALRSRLNDAIAERQSQLTSILTRHGVGLFVPR